jgi:hypothetical protein
MIWAWGVASSSMEASPANVGGLISKSLKAMVVVARAEMALPWR